VYVQSSVSSGKLHFPAAKRGDGRDSRSVPVAGQIGTTSQLIGTELHGIIVLVTGDVFDFHALPLAEAVVDRQAEGRAVPVQRSLHDALDGRPIGSTCASDSRLRRLIGIAIPHPLIPARIGDRRLLDLRLHRAALPLTLGLRCGRLRGEW